MPKRKFCFFCADKVEEIVCFLLFDRCVADLVYDEQIRLDDLSYAKIRGALYPSGLKQLHKIRHPFETDGVSFINCCKTK